MPNFLDVAGNVNPENQNPYRMAGRPLVLETAAEVALREAMDPDDAILEDALRFADAGYVISLPENPDDDHDINAVRVGAISREGVSNYSGPHNIPEGADIIGVWNLSELRLNGSAVNQTNGKVTEKRYTGRNFADDIVGAAYPESNQFELVEDGEVIATCDDGVLCHLHRRHNSVGSPLAQMLGILEPDPLGIMA